jgi:hypothetical protein
MASKSKGPRWGWLYLVLPFAGGLLWLEHQAPMPVPLHQVTLIFIVLLVFGLIALWSQQNADMLERQQRQGRYPGLTGDPSARDNTAAETVKGGTPAPVPPRRQPRDYGLNPVMVVIGRDDMRTDSSFSEEGGPNGR